MKQMMTLLLMLALIFSCTDDENSTIDSGTLTINYIHSWGASPIDVEDFNQLKFTTANNDDLSITKLRYLISKITLKRSDNSLFETTAYTLVDLNEGHVVTTIKNVPFADYSAIGFTFGFDENDNIDGAYTDLNSASWNWPEMLGGGYHFMQFEGKYDADGIESPFAYHMGTARRSADVFEQNYFETEIDGFNFSEEVEIHVNMDLSEWFVNPIVWDLSEYNTTLMPNYDAQKMMQANGATVFSLYE